MNWRIIELTLGHVNNMLQRLGDRIEKERKAREALAERVKALEEE